MGSMSNWHWIIVLAVGLLLFGGRGKISELMGDFAKGIKAFKKGMTEEETAQVEPTKVEPIKTLDRDAGRGIGREPQGGLKGRTRAPGGFSATRRAPGHKQPCGADQ